MIASTTVGRIANIGAVHLTASSLETLLEPVAAWRQTGVNRHQHPICCQGASRCNGLMVLLLVLGLVHRRLPTRRWWGSLVPFCELSLDVLENRSGLLNGGELGCWIKSR